MVRLCSKSSRPYSGRPAVPPRRRRRERRSVMATGGRQDSAEAVVVPRVTSRKRRNRRPHNSGRAELGRQNTTIGGLVPGRSIRLAEHWTATIVAEKEWLL